MKSAHRAASRAKRRFHADSSSWSRTIAANMEQPKENADRIMVLLRVAFEKLKHGCDDHEQFDRLAAAFNVGLIRSESIDPLAEQTMNLGLDALINCDGIRMRHGRYGFTGPDLIAICDALDCYDQILRLSAPKQMADALEIAARRMRSGDVRNAA